MPSDWGCATSVATPAPSSPSPRVPYAISSIVFLRVAPLPLITATHVTGCRNQNHYTLFFLTDSHSVMSVILCHHEGTRGSMFLTGNRIYHSTEYIRSVWITCRDGLFYCRQLKNLQTSLPAVAQLVFFSRRRTALCSRHAVVLSSEHTSYCEIDALRLKKISPYDTG